MRGYDYAQSGAYFVTISTYRYAHIFGEIVNDTMHLNAYGRIVVEDWEWLAGHHKLVELDAFVVMPNHLHGIIVITGGEGGSRPALPAMPYNLPIEKTPRVRRLNMHDLTRLAELLKEKHLIDEKIANLVGRPAQIGHVGEYIASAIFDIRLEASATAKGIDGHFATGPLAGRSVNVKWYAKLESLLDLTPAYLPDEYLVLTGPRSMAVSSRGVRRPWLIQLAFLFDAHELVNTLAARGSKLGIASSVPRQYWEAAEIYPVQRNDRLPLSDEQRATLSLFA